MGREEKFTLVNSAIGAHLATADRTLQGPVDIDAQRQKIASTVYYAASVKGWW